MGSDVMDVVFEVTVFGRHLAAAPQGIEFAQVLVLGNAPELGAWDSQRAVPLQLTEESAAEKKFSVTVAFPVEREHFPLEYKYIIKDTQTNEVVSWEAIPGNRSLTLSTGSNVAREKPATQSSTYVSDRMPSPGDRAASLGNDGNHNGFYEWCCPRTKREVNPWWSVDLEATVDLQALNLWKASTYHEQPKQSSAKPPASAVRQASRSSVLPAPPVWVFVSTEDLSGKTGDDLIKLAKAPGYLPDTIRAFRVEWHEDRRVETLSLGGVKGRHVRVQYESEAASLQFSEVEVFSKSVEESASPVKRLDGFYGVEAAEDGDLHEYIDTEWVDPRSDRSLVRVWIGSFEKEKPAIHWLDGSTDRKPIHVAMRHCVQPKKGSGAEFPSQDLPIDSRGASLLDKDGAELQQDLAVLAHQTRDLKPYLNSTGLAGVDDWLRRFTTTQLLSDAHVTQLKAQIKTQTFQDGEPLLKYREQSRTAYFITKGEVVVAGPPTVTGVEELGTVSASVAVNDLALFSAWPERSAAIVARGSVEAQVVTFEAFKSALGGAKLRLLREHLLRERSSLPTEKNTGVKKLLVVDQDHAQVFRTKVPTAALSTSEGSNSHRLELQFYEAADVGSSITSNTERGNLLGVAPLLLSQLNQHGEGLLTVPILSKTEGDETISVVGQVSLHYLIVRPFVHANNTLASVWRSYWRERVPLNGGHRGMGRHFNQVGGFRKALTRENTLASFLLAGRSGADFVEFDVQLTKDHVPVLYHDFILRVGLEDKRAWSEGAKAEQHEIAIHQMTERELTRSQTSVVPRKEMGTFKRLVKKHWRAILNHTTTPTASQASRGTVGEGPSDDEHLVDFYPRLEDLLKHVPPEIGLNVEIKYPDRFKRSNYRFSPSFAMNYYVDTILQCVFDHAGTPTRRIFFSCFDPDLVVLLRAKQATYPVFFLTYGRVQPAVDARLTLQFAINFVGMEKLRGIVSNSDEFITNPACVELVKRQGTVLMTWGDQNTSHEYVQLQKRHAIDGVISDNIGDLTRKDQEKKGNSPGRRA